jgi:hypothetical protein
MSQREDNEKLFYWHSAPLPVKKIVLGSNGFCQLKMLTPRHALAILPAFSLKIVPG